jgi:hypothetical protein
VRIGPPRNPSFGAIVLLSLVLVLGALAKDKARNLVAVQGKVFLIDNDTSAIMVDTKTDSRRLLIYSANTRFEYGRSGKGRESSPGQIKETDYISCTGTLDDRGRLVAMKCVYRESK